ncbi:MAG: ABC transporter ATP-binding protein [Candidatus Caenarcaniphilales bacterium]|nr:ABC transporter ATP-binding protein [Candidatus Caenarcaniphilales bacterium]
MSNDDYTKLDAFRLLRESLSEQGKDLTVVLIYALVVALLSLIIPLAVQELVNIIAFGVVLQPIIILTALVIGGLFLMGVFRIIQKVVVEIIQQRLFVKVAIKVIESIRRAERTELDRKKINLFFETMALQKSYGKLFTEGLSALLQIFIGLFILIFYHPFFIILDFLLVLGILICLFLAGRGALKTSLEESKHKYELVHWLQDFGLSRQVFRLIPKSELVFKRTDQINLNYLEARGHHFDIIVRQNIMSLMLQTLGSAALLGMGGFLVFEERLTIGQLVAAEVLIALVLAAVDKFVNMIDVIYDLLTALVKLNFVDHLKRDYTLGEKSLPLGEPLSLICQNLCFSYDGASEILHNINLEVRKGEFITITGTKGTGKTTLARLLAGIQLPQKGTIYLNGLEVREIDQNSLGESVSMIDIQRDLVFEGSLADNILLGREERLPLKKVLELSTLEQFMDRFEKWIDSPILSQGLNFSQSQIATILVARALVTKPGLIVICPSFQIIEDQLERQILYNLRHMLDYLPTIIFCADEHSVSEFSEHKYELINGELKEVL